MNSYLWYISSWFFLHDLDILNMYIIRPAINLLYIQLCVTLCYRTDVSMISEASFACPAMAW